MAELGLTIQQVIDTANVLNDTVRSGKPLKVAVKDFNTLMLDLLFAVAQGSGTVNIGGQILDIAQPGTLALADFKINEASQAIQFIIRQVSFINDLQRQVGQIS
jgi:hypothetical protein